ncbi:MAG: hypothetical protein HRU21_04020 [Pseudomonadales bacterium]|nr:hypothetical protein [Pseudomonadales bacterium]
MLIPRSIILLILVMFIFSPAIEQWVSNNQAAWYRPYVAWGLIILIVFLNQWRTENKPKQPRDY